MLFSEHVFSILLGLVMGKKAKTPEKSAETDQNDTVNENEADRPSYEELITKLSVISKPLASKKLTKKLYKTVKKGEYY